MASGRTQGDEGDGHSGGMSEPLVAGQESGRSRWVLCRKCPEPGHSVDPDERQ